MNEESKAQTTDTFEESTLADSEIQDGKINPPPTVQRGKGAINRGAINRAPTDKSALYASRQRANTADLMKAHVALMEKEVILPKQLDLFRLVNRHYSHLQTWHDQHTGWHIQRGATVIRLVRHLSASTPGYVYDRLREPRDFACLTWILWYAENRQLSGRGNEQQFLLSQLADSIAQQSATGGDDEQKFDFRKQADRYSIQRALQYLEDLGGLQLVDGQTREWIEQTPGADVLYEFTDIIRSLVSALKPQILGRGIPQEISPDPEPGIPVPQTGHPPPQPGLHVRLNDPTTTLQPTFLSGLADEPVTASPLTRAWRVLLLGPALFRFDDPAAFAELVAHADEVAHELLETFGWLLEVNRDYACVVRASGMATGPVRSLTPFGTDDQIALLLCGAIRSRVESGEWPSADQYGCLHVTAEDMTELFYTVRERYGENWGSEARNKSSRSLLNDVYRKMRQVGLLRGPDEAGNVLILPTAARYSATYEKEGEETTQTTRSSRTRSKKGKATPDGNKGDSLWNSA